MLSGFILPGFTSTKIRSINIALPDVNADRINGEGLWHKLGGCKFGWVNSDRMNTDNINLGDIYTIFDLEEFSTVVSISLLEQVEIFSTAFILSRFTSIMNTSTKFSLLGKNRYITILSRIVIVFRGSLTKYCLVFVLWDLRAVSTSRCTKGGFHSLEQHA